MTEVKKLAFSLDIRVGKCYTDFTFNWGRENSSVICAFLYAAGALSIDCATINNCRLWLGYLLDSRRMIKKSVITYAVALLVCLCLALSARAAIVDANDEWLMPLEPYTTITCVAHFIPDIPTVVPESLIFTKAPKWTDAYPFDYVGAGWNTAVSGDGKVAYLYGPAITNGTPLSWDLFSYSLFYQWDDEDPYYDEKYPVWVDISVFNGLELLIDGSVRGIPGGPWDDVYDVTWKEQYFPGSGPYENPVPEPMTICLLGLGAAFLRKRRFPKIS